MAIVVKNKTERWSTSTRPASRSASAPHTGSPINVGDLLTTSTTRGDAMRAENRHRAIGVILGESLCPLTDGRGLITVLISLQ
jgi:hypothetical protein